VKVTEIAILALDGVYDREKLRFSLKDPRSITPYQVKGITGLDAEDIMPQYYGALAGTIPNKRYNMVLRKRTVAMKLGLNPRFTNGDSYSELRAGLYRLISSSPTGELALRFYNGTTVVGQLKGHVTKLEADQFSKTQDAQLTIECKKPMIVGVTPVIINVSGLDPQNTVITESVSTAPHGFTFRIRVTTQSNAINMRVDASGLRFDLSVINYPFLVGDLITVNSVIGERSVVLERPGVGTFYMAEAVQSNSVWPTLYPGVNTFKMNEFGPANAVWEDIRYYASHWGV
jgi:hypothetical protein